MNPTLDFYWVFLFVPLKTAKQFHSFRRNFFTVKEQPNGAESRKV